MEGPSIWDGVEQCRLLGQPGHVRQPDLIVSLFLCASPGKGRVDLNLLRASLYTRVCVVPSWQLAGDVLHRFLVNRLAPASPD